MKKRFLNKPIQKPNKKKNISNLKHERGITLVSLVITIATILILVAISILVIVNGNSIIKMAEKGKKEKTKAEELEQIKMAVTSAIISSKNDQLTTKILEEELQKSELNGELIGSEEWKYIGSESNYIIEKNGNVYVGDKNILPAEYQQIEYLESSGTQYIDTGVIGQTGLKSKMKISFTEVPNDGTVLGSRNGDTRYYLLHVYPSKWCAGYGEYYSSNIQVNKDTIYEVDSDINNSNQTIVVNKDSVYSTNDKININTNLNLYIFALNHNNSIKYPSSLKVYYLKIFDGNNLIRDFIPVKRKNDSKLGMYDQVNGIFYINKGTGEFIAGPDVK